MISFKIIDPDNCGRLNHLEYFASLEAPHLSITASVDVTDLVSFCRLEKASFFLAFLHCTALAADSIPAFRQRIHRLSEDELHSGLHTGAFTSGPLSGCEIREYAECPTSHTEDSGNGLYCYCTVSHHMPWHTYMTSAAELQRKAREAATIDEDSDVEAYLFCSCIPWIHYSSITNPFKDRFDTNPRISWGKYEEDFRGRLMMPLTVAAHHSLVDGIRIADFFTETEKNIRRIVSGE